MNESADLKSGKKYRSSLNLWLPAYEELYFLVNHIRPPTKKIQGQQFILYSHPVSKQTAYAITRVLHEAGFDARVLLAAKVRAELDRANALVPSPVEREGNYAVFFHESKVRKPQYSMTEYGMDAVTNRAIRNGKLNVNEFVWISYIDPVFAVLRARVEAGIKFKKQMNGWK